MRLLLFPDTAIKQELYLFVQGSVFALGENGESCLQACRYTQRQTDFLFTHGIRDDEYPITLRLT